MSFVRTGFTYVVLIIALMAPGANAAPKGRPGEAGEGLTSTATHVRGGYISMQLPPDARLGVVLSIQILPSAIQLVDIKEDENGVNVEERRTASGREGEPTEGALREAALNAARTWLYNKNPNLLIADEGAELPEGWKWWTYKIIINGFEEFRTPEGVLAIALDGRVEVSDENGRAVVQRGFVDPPGKRMTLAEIQKEIDQAPIEREFVRGFLSIFSRFFSATPVAKVTNNLEADVTSSMAARTRMLERNAVTIKPALLPYQYQEIRVRYAVESMLHMAGPPGVSPPESLRFELKRPKSAKKETPELVAFEMAQNFLNSRDLDRAIEHLRTLPESPENAYNIGALLLKQAAEQSNPNKGEEGFARAKEAAGLLKSAALKQRDATQLAAAAERLAARLEPVSFAPGSITRGILASYHGRTSPVPGSKHAILIGVSNFNAPNFNPGPRGVSNDLKNMRNALLQCGYKGDNIITLPDATVPAVKQAMYEVSRKVARDSQLLVYVASHGMTEDGARNGYAEGYIICADTQGEADLLKATAYRMVDFRAHVDALIQCDQKIVLQDTCQAAQGAQVASGLRVREVEWPKNFAVLASCGPDQKSVGNDSGGAFTTTFINLLKKHQGAAPLGTMLDQLRIQVPIKAAEISQRELRHKIEQVPVGYFGPGAELIALNPNATALKSPATK